MHLNLSPNIGYKLSIWQIINTIIIIIINFSYEPYK